MLLDESVARSIAVLRWVDELATALAGPLRIAHGVLSKDPAERCELRGIGDALQREVHRLQAGSGRQTRALSAPKSSTVSRYFCISRNQPIQRDRYLFFLASALTSIAVSVGNSAGIRPSPSFCSIAPVRAKLINGCGVVSAVR